MELPTDPSSPQPAQKEPGSPQIRTVGRIPRPANGFLLWRRALSRGELEGYEHVQGLPQKDISRIAGAEWNVLPAEIKNEWLDKGEAAKREHARKYPHYRYQPRFKPRKPRRKNAAHTVGGTGCEESTDYVLPLKLPPILPDMQSMMDRRLNPLTLARPNPLHISSLLNVDHQHLQQQHPPPFQYNLHREPYEEIARNSAAWNVGGVYRQSAAFPLSPEGRRYPPRLYRPLGATQPAVDPLHSAFSQPSYPTISDILALQALQASELGGAYAAASPSNAYPPSDPPPMELFDMNTYDVNNPQMQGWGTTIDNQPFDLQSFHWDTLGLPPFSQETQGTSQSPQVETPGPNGGPDAAPALSQNVCAATDVFQTGPCDSYTNQEGVDERAGGASDIQPPSSPN